MVSRHRIARRMQLVLVFVLLAELAAVLVVTVVTLVRPRTEAPPSHATCPELDVPDPRTRTWHPGDQLVLHWYGQPCYPGTASGLPVTLNVRLYGPFASDTAADAFVQAKCGTVNTTSSPAIALAAAAATLHTDTSVANEPNQTLTLPVSLPLGDYVVKATATIHNPGVGSTGNGETCFPVVLAPATGVAARDGRS